MGSGLDNLDLQETLKDRACRLKNLAASFKTAVRKLKSSYKLLQKDQRYAMQQQREKGADEWQNFLDSCLEQQQDQNYEFQGK